MSHCKRSPRTHTARSSHPWWFNCCSTQPLWTRWSCLPGHASNQRSQPDVKFHGETDIEFWGLLIGAEGVRPDPAKVEALQHITPPTSREELVSFLCMMQSNSDFVPNFSQMSSKLREMTKSNANFKWTTEHLSEFVNLIQAFRKDTLLRYFDLGMRTFLFTDAHISGLGAILAQGETVDTAKPVAFASRTTSPAEKRYPQIDLEVTAVDFALRRFCNYLVGALDVVNVITDHKPLGPIFNGNRTGSIRTERIKLKHQELNKRWNIVLYLPF